MTGCRRNAKNTLDKNYLYLAQQLGAEILAEHEVFDVVPNDGADGKSGYTVHFKSKKQRKTVQTKGIVFAGGVMGTMPLLLKIKDTSLPNLSEKLGCQVSTNNEALINITSKESQQDFTKGIAIGSILHTDEHSHLEPVRYGHGSSFFKSMLLPMAHGSNFFIRFFKMLWELIKSPISYLQILFDKEFSSKTSILLFMQTVNSTIRIKRRIHFPIIFK